MKQLEHDSSEASYPAAVPIGQYVPPSQRLKRKQSPLSVHSLRAPHAGIEDMADKQNMKHYLAYEQNKVQLELLSKLNLYIDVLETMKEANYRRRGIKQVIERVRGFIPKLTHYETTTTDPDTLAAYHNTRKTDRDSDAASEKCDQDTTVAVDVQQAALEEIKITTLNSEVEDITTAELNSETVNDITKCEDVVTAKPEVETLQDTFKTKQDDTAIQDSIRAKPEDDDQRQDTFSDELKSEEIEEAVIAEPKREEAVPGRLTTESTSGNILDLVTTREIVADDKEIQDIGTAEPEDETSMVTGLDSIAVKDAEMPLPEDLDTAAVQPEHTVIEESVETEDKAIGNYTVSALKSKAVQDTFKSEPESELVQNSIPEPDTEAVDDEVENFAVRDNVTAEPEDEKVDDSVTAEQESESIQDTITEPDSEAVQDSGNAEFEHFTVQKYVTYEPEDTTFEGNVTCRMENNGTKPQNERFLETELDSAAVQNTEVPKPNSSLETARAQLAIEDKVDQESGHNAVTDTRVFEAAEQENKSIQDTKTAEQDIEAAHHTVKDVTSEAEYTTVQNTVQESESVQDTIPEPDSEAVMKTEFESVTVQDNITAETANQANQNTITATQESESVQDTIPEPDSEAVVLESVTVQDNITAEKAIPDTVTATQESESVQDTVPEPDSEAVMKTEFESVTVQDNITADLANNTIQDTVTATQECESVQDTIPEPDSEAVEKTEFESVTVQDNITAKTANQAIQNATQESESVQDTIPEPDREAVVKTEFESVTVQDNITAETANQAIQDAVTATLKSESVQDTIPEPDSEAVVKTEFESVTVQDNITAETANQAIQDTVTATQECNLVQDTIPEPDSEAVVETEFAVQDNVTADRVNQAIQDTVTATRECESVQDTKTAKSDSGTVQDTEAEIVYTSVTSVPEYKTVQETVTAEQEGESIQYTIPGRESEAVQDKVTAEPEDERVQNTVTKSEREAVQDTVTPESNDIAAQDTFACNQVVPKTLAAQPENETTFENNFTTEADSDTIQDTTGKMITEEYGGAQDTEPVSVDSEAVQGIATDEQKTEPAEEYVQDAFNAELGEILQPECQKIQDSVGAKPEKDIAEPDSETVQDTVREPEGVTIPDVATDEAESEAVHDSVKAEPENTVVKGKLEAKTKQGQELLSDSIRAEQGDQDTEPDSEAFADNSNGETLATAEPENKDVQEMTKFEQKAVQSTKSNNTAMSTCATGQGIAIDGPIAEYVQDTESEKVGEKQQEKEAAHENAIQGNISTAELKNESPSNTVPADAQDVLMETRDLKYTLVGSQISSTTRAPHKTHAFRKFREVLKKSHTTAGLNEVSNFLLPMKSISRSLPSMFNYSSKSQNKTSEDNLSSGNLVQSEKEASTSITTATPRNKSVN